MPATRNRTIHLAAVLLLTRKAAAASFRVAPCSITNLARLSRLRNVSRAFLWTSIRFLQRNLVARHNQLLRVKSNGQHLERSQVPLPAEKEQAMTTQAPDVEVVSPET